MTRTLIYAMQSSGASAYAFNLGRLAAQRGRTLCIPDLWNPHRAPTFDDVNVDHVVLKVVVSNRYTLDQHILSFNPTETFLFRRERQSNIRSLSCKPYSNESGDMAFKFSLFDTELSRNRFPVIEYEDMQWIEVSKADIDRMIMDNYKLSYWAVKEYLKSWGFGGIRTT